MYKTRNPSEGSMLVVDTYIGPSEINGIGLFAKKNISKGKIVWRFNPFLDLRYTEVENYSRLIRDYLKKHAYLDEDGDWYLCGDNARFMNHSKTPNLITKNGKDYAVRNIKKGEELTIDYYTFDLDAKRKLENAKTIPL